jgi:mRNA-degrading endonuclease RelE of RelBE toxin-antitoxin system
VNWEVAFTTGALRGLERLPEKVATAIVSFATETLPANPHRMSKPLRDELEGFYSARRGDYRVIFSLDEQLGQLLIIRVSHRSDSYR